MRVLHNNFSTIKYNLKLRFFFLLSRIKQPQMHRNKPFNEPVLLAMNIFYNKKSYPPKFEHLKSHITRNGIVLRKSRMEISHKKTHHTISETISSAIFSISFWIFYITIFCKRFLPIYTLNSIYIIFMYKEYIKSLSHDSIIAAL